MSEWREVALKDITQLVIDYRGKTPLKLGGEWSDSGYRALSAKNVKTGIIVAEESIRYVDEDLYRKWMKDEVQRGDILITSEAPFGEVFFWNSDEKIVLSQRLFDVRIKDDVCAQYVYYYMTSYPFQAELRSRASGTTVLGLKQPELLKTKVVLPDYGIQKKIAAQLSEIDDKIAVNRRICENLEAQAQALFKHWFIDFAPFNNGKFVESELGMIPEGWRVEIVDSFCKVFTGRKNTNQAEETGLYPFFSCAPEPLASNEYLYDGYAVIVAGNGSYTGRTTIYQGKFDLYQRTYACVAKEESFDTNIIFIYYMMKSSFEREKMGGTRGTSIPYIVMKDITHQSFCYNKEWIEKFSNIVRPMLEQKFRLSIESTRLSTLRDTLLPKLMSGQIKV